MINKGHDSCGIVEVMEEDLHMVGTRLRSGVVRDVLLTLFYSQWAN